jgi:hypothetical protein
MEGKKIMPEIINDQRQQYAYVHTGLGLTKMRFIFVAQGAQLAA